MLYLNFLFCGTNFKKGVYLREKHQQEQISFPKNSGNFEGKKTVVNINNDITDVFIDETVKIKTVSQKRREEMQKFWHGNQRKCLLSFTITIITGLVGIAVGVALSILFVPLLPVTASVSSVAFSTFGSSFFMLFRGIQAKKQKNQWADPFPRMIEKRQKIKRKGIPYIMKHDLKNTLISTDELLDFWKKTLNELNENSFDTVNEIDLFFKDNPLQVDSLEYTYGKLTEENEIKNISNEYMTMEKEYYTHTKLKMDGLSSIKKKKGNHQQTINHIIDEWHKFIIKVQEFSNKLKKNEITQL